MIRNEFMNLGGRQARFKYALKGFKKPLIPTMKYSAVEFYPQIKRKA
jgi:hypothetical protein